MCFFGDQEKDKWNEEGKQCHEESRNEGLDYFFLPRMMAEVVFL
jgi:hypothetical protein